MAYFEMTLINSPHDQKTFDIQVNPHLYEYLTNHDCSNQMGEDWFDITLNQKDVKTIQKLCKTNEENELIGKNVRKGTIIDILIHRSIIISKK